MTRLSLRAIGRAASMLVAVTMPRTAPAQTPAARFVDSARVVIDRAVENMDPEGLNAAVVLLDRALVAFPDDPYLLHYRGYAHYWQAVGAMMGGDKEHVSPAVTLALADLGKSAERLAWPETVQLEASLNGLRIAVDPGNGPTLGPLTARLSAEATKMAPDNPRVLLLQAHLAESTPASMGGGAARARELAGKAVEAFARDHPGPLGPSWGKAEAEAMMRRLSK
jgi:hypothetical protein